MPQAVDMEAAAELPRTEVDLNGEFRLKVDGKGRVTLPAKFRKVLSSDLTVTRDPFDECIYAFEAPGFNQWVESVMSGAFPERKANDRKQDAYHRALKGRARDVEVDSAGRIMLSADMREACGIDKDVVVVGNGSRFEIWDTQRYEDELASVDLSLLFT